MTRSCRRRSRSRERERDRSREHRDRDRDSHRDRDRDRDREREKDKKSRRSEKASDPEQATKISFLASALGEVRKPSEGDSSGKKEVVEVVDESAILKVDGPLGLKLGVGVNTKKSSSTKVAPNSVCLPGGCLGLVTHDCKLFNADEEEEEREREKQQRKKMKIERIDYGVSTTFLLSQLTPGVR
eukprot:749349-Hanusia_phi.AAC.3